MKKVLIIDDEQRTRELIAKMIESFELDIQTFPVGENVQSGLAAIQEIKPDLVFLDIQMPGKVEIDDRLRNAIEKQEITMETRLLARRALT